MFDGDEELSAEVHRWSRAVYVQLELFSSFALLAVQTKQPEAEAVVSEMLLPYLRLFCHCIRCNKRPSELPREYQLLLLDALCILGSPDAAAADSTSNQQQQLQQLHPLYPPRPRQPPPTAAAAAPGVAAAAAAAE